MTKWQRNSRGQVTVETAVLFGFVVAGLVAMAAYLQRGVQGGMKSNADSLGTQFQANNPWNSTTTSVSTETDATISQTQTVDYDQTLVDTAQ